jgi:RTX calcium-binding nonapeptide repeat (4 copies)
LRGRTLLIAVVAVLSLLSATAFAKGHPVVHGSKHADHLKFGKGNNRVFARGGDDAVFGGGGRDRLRGGRGDDVLLGGAGADRLRGGQDDDVLDGGPGDDYLFARGDGGDADQVVCGAGEDTVVLGRNDTIVVEAETSADGCEHVKRPGGPNACASHDQRCVAEGERPCASSHSDCDDPLEEPCTANAGACDDPVATEPEPDEAVEAPDTDEPESL